MYCVKCTEHWTPCSEESNNFVVRDQSSSSKSEQNDASATPRTTPTGMVMVTLADTLALTSSQSVQIIKATPSDQTTPISQSNSITEVNQLAVSTTSVPGNQRVSLLTPSNQLNRSDLPVPNTEPQTVPVEVRTNNEILTLIITNYSIITNINYPVFKKTHRESSVLLNCEILLLQRYC